MILKANTLTNFLANSERTEMLITSMVKIKAYNWMYQDKTFEKNLEFGYTVKKVQDEELRKIEISCSEHAIISLSTNFEVFYKDILQELLNKYPHYFINKRTKHQEKIKEMCSSSKRFNYELIAQELGLMNRFDYYNFFEEYNLDFLLSNEKQIIEHIFVVRNNYVHNAGKMNKKTKQKLKKHPSPTNEGYLTTEAKRLRTKFKRMIFKVYERLIKQLDK